MSAPDTPSSEGLQIHRLHTRHFGGVQACAFEFGEKPHSQQIGVAIVVGDDLSTPPLVRVHSRCLYGEVFRSLECDCLAQLELTWDRIQAEGSGVVIYLEQEGRGCGLMNKARAYSLMQTEGIDTVEAYRRLGLPLDLRQYRSAAAVLHNFGFRSVRLLTNNPTKIAGLVQEGIAVEQMYLRTTPTQWNRDYLETKQTKLGHDLGLEPHGQPERSDAGT
jgi:GTP cyclohydrolase II